MRVSIMGNQQSFDGRVVDRPPVLHGAADERPAPAEAMPPLRLALHGLTDDEISILDAILRVLGERTARRWVLADGRDGDLLLTTRDAPPGRHGAPLTALLLRDDERPAVPDELVLQAPLRVMAVLDLLNAAHDRLRQPAAPTPGGEQARIEVDDGRSLAAALSRLVERRPEQALRVRIVGHGTLYLCLKARIYHCDFPRERFVDALNEHRFVVTMIPSSAAELVVRLDSARALDEALWQIGLITAADGVSHAGRAYRLTRWPDFARLPHRPEFLRLCAAMSRTHRSVDALVALGGLQRGEVEHLLHACALCGYLDVAPQAAELASPHPASAPASRAGLFDRLRKRFGL
ncbi:hypothetical protein [Chiayiivirga flava]|uniref:Uncharacterized protein n=1 Tax=Chiayiivirga flava TaxID=659595 RepID=A0A7W8FY13_9GAMM|nr:hypothetical protein [Chiayiivirga flava]MBB5206917.1 hypothetical protein [Chiayiivirga flava]